LAAFSFWKRYYKNCRMNTAKSELIFVGFLLVVLFIFGVIATALFVRQWRRENKRKNGTKI
jgi:hypothetical protein